MLAARIDQENAVHAHQTAAAAKPLNQGVKGLAPKTPGNRAPKTPFKIALNDENELGKGGKGGFGKGLGASGKQQGAKTERNAFQTPAPRDRPALGFKTTNGKALAFKTPAPKNAGPSPEKTQRKTVGRSKLQIHKEVKEAEPQESWADREIEYIAPRPTPLPDVASDDEFAKLDFSMLKGKNLTRGWAAEYHRDSLAEFEAEDAKIRKKEQEELEKECAGLTQELLDMADEEEYEMPAVVKKIPTKPVGTVVSRSAASALSRPSKPLPSYAAPTVAAKAKTPSFGILGNKKLAPASVVPIGNGRASHSTLGYAKGRAVSNNIRQPLAGVFKADELQPKPKRKNPLKELEDIVRAREYAEAGLGPDDDDADFVGGGVPLYDEDEGEVFQFKIPEE